MRSRPFRPEIRLALFVLSLSGVGASTALAQAVVTGVVKDVSGAVLPGVTVEAASPLLIERVRSAVTDGTGQYRIIDLRPGSYDITFALPGFNTVKRESVVLAGTATVTVNADLKVGAVTETVTVTGESPIVDVQGVAAEHSVTRELLDSVPTSRTLHAVATLIPGVVVQGGLSNPNVADVGGSALSFSAQTSIHGGNPSDQRLMMEGLPIAATAGTTTTDFQVNVASIQELTIDTAGLSAEDYSGGIRMNVIPREGGNAFHGLFFVDGAGPSLQSSNYNDDLKARGYPEPNPSKPLQKTYNINPAAGGPIVKEKLWFYAAVNRVRNSTYVAIYPNKNAGNPNAWTYVPDPAGTFPTLDVLFYGENGRLTWQATPRNKFAFYFDTQVRCSCPQATAALSPEAQSSRFLPVSRFVSVSYTAPLSNRVIVDLAALDRFEPSRTTGALGLDPSIIQVVDNGLGITYRNFGESGANRNHNDNLRGSLSVVTGAHALKAGFQTEFGTNETSNVAGTQQVAYRFTNGTPNLVTLFADPRQSTTKATEVGLFVQDRWTIKRLTVTGGLRYDSYSTRFPDQTLGSIPLAPTRNISFPAADGAHLQDITTRMGAAYDVFGNGRTAVKVSLNKYLSAMNTGTAGAGAYNLGYQLNPANRIATSTTRSWNDATFPVGDARRGNFVPDCVLSQPTANGECGALANTSFGLPITTTTFDPELVNAWNRRLSNWELTAGVQQQVFSRLAVDLTYIRRSYGNTTVTDNLALAPSDFTPFSIVAPVDARLPNGGGYTIAGLYDVSPAKFGQVDNLNTFASNYGDVTRNWQGFDLTASIRAMNGLTFQGGLSTGSTFQDICAVKAKLPEWTRALLPPFTPTSPTDPYCRYSTQWLTQIKGLGTYSVPKVDVRVSLGIQSMAGPEIAANFNATNALTQPSLGRPLAGGVANVPVNLVQPGSLYGERMNTVDMRLSKIVRLPGRNRLSLDMDLFNMFNVSTVLNQNPAYSPTTTTWQTPQTVIAGRLVKFGAQFDF
ncbi:MAG: carboxypeptidase regulatory-like domain-containing protein [Verrucomicrobiota bacterium]